MRAADAPAQGVGGAGHRQRCAARHRQVRGLCRCNRVQLRLCRRLWHAASGIPQPGRTAPRNTPEPDERTPDVSGRDSHPAAATSGATPHGGPHPQINRAFERLFAALSARGLVGRTGDMVGVFVDDPAATAEAALRSFAGVLVDDDFPCAAPVAP